MSQINYFEVGEELHCLRCHQDIKRDDFFPHVDVTCPKKDVKPYLTGCRYEGKIKI